MFPLFSSLSFLSSILFSYFLSPPLNKIDIQSVKLLNCVEKSSISVRCFLLSPFSHLSKSHWCVKTMNSKHQTSNVSDSFKTFPLVRFFLRPSVPSFLPFILLLFVRQAQQNQNSTSISFFLSFSKASNYRSLTLFFYSLTHLWPLSSFVIKQPGQCNNKSFNIFFFLFFSKMSFSFDFGVFLSSIKYVSLFIISEV